MSSHLPDEDWPQDVFAAIWEPWNAEWNSSNDNSASWPPLNQPDRDRHQDSESHGSASFAPDLWYNTSPRGPVSQVNSRPLPSPPPAARDFPAPPVTDPQSPDECAWFPIYPTWRLLSTQRDQHHIQQPGSPSRSTRRPTASHREDWIDHTALQRPIDPRGFPDSIFETVSDRGQSPVSSRQHTPDYGVLDLDDLDNFLENAGMPDPAHRRRPTNVVDLTGGTSPIDDGAPSQSQARKRPTHTPSSSERAAKRRATSSAIEEIDLANETPSPEEELRQQQQQDAIRAQQSTDANQGPQRIGKRQCIICMENYTNATTTACGHFYCHECLIHALVAGEKNSDRNVANCPVCRTPLTRKKPYQVIPISFMKKETFERNRQKNLDAAS